jgi:tetratricopeptide (TPR) repeat protein
VYLALADFYLKNKKFTDARELYKDYIIKYPDDLNSLNNFAYLSAFLNKDLNQALILIDKAITLSNDNYSKQQYMDTKADVLIKLKRYSEALETIELALKITDDDEMKNVLLKKRDDIRTILKE